MPSGRPLLVLLLLAVSVRADESPPLTETAREELTARADRLRAAYFQLHTRGRTADALKTALTELDVQKQLHAGDHLHVARTLGNIGYLNMSLRQPAKALAAYQESLAMRQRLFPDQDNLLVADSLNNVGMAHQHLGQYEQALEHLQQSLDMTRRLSAGEENQSLAVNLNNLGLLYEAMGQPEKGIPCFREALAMYRRLLGGQDHPSLVNTLHNLGMLYFVSMYQPEQALPCYREALEMNRRLYPDQDHPDLATSLHQLGHVYSELNQPEQALPLCQAALAMRQRLYPGQDRSDLATGLQNVGTCYLRRGQPEQALPYYQQSLNMLQRLYPEQDHSDLAASLNNLGSLLRQMGLAEEALRLTRAAVDMNRRLRKDQAHPELAGNLDNLALLLLQLGKQDEALPCFREALEIRRKLFSDRDHPELALSLNNLGYFHKKEREHETSLRYYQEALAMHQRLHQDRPHPEWAATLHNLGNLLIAMGQSEEALPYFQQALAMYQRLNRRFAYQSSLPDALDQLHGFPRSHYGLLSASRRVQGQDARSYESLWTTKAALGQLFRTRRALELQQQSAEMQQLLEEYRTVQRQLTGLLAQPASTAGGQLNRLTGQIQRLEREIGNRLPARTELAELELRQLTGLLQPEEALLDFYRYYDVAAKSRQERFRYCAFVVTAGQPPVRVELPESAEVLETAIRQWREKLLEWSPALPEPARLEVQAQTDRAALKVRELLWKPLESHLPGSLKRLYVSPDGDLARVPFAAIPAVAAGTTLLDHYALATVESGPFLWSQLASPPATATDAETLLLAGGIQYSPPGVPASPWTFLQGSMQEARQVQQLWGARGELQFRSGHEATTDWLLQTLPAVRYAHLATHGEFREAEFARERLQLEQEVQSRLDHLDSPSAALGLQHGSGFRNPLGYVGIVMADANQPAENSPDQGIVSGSSLWPLDLSPLKLCVLSACETGLGEQTGGAGVQNLQLALHVAGCENVVASLWKVDDAATAALMAKFYYELWERGQPPVEALRSAQLLVRDRPDLIPGLSGQRGRLQVAESVRVQPGPLPGEKPPEPGQPQPWPAQYWAAFTLSGAGK